MFDTIINLFFDKKNKSVKRDRVTILVNRNLTEYREINKVNLNLIETKTCLSKYFDHIKGLNYKERVGVRF